MRATRLLARAAAPDSFSRPMNLLLPRQTFWDVMGTSLEGLWAQIRDPASREAFEDAVQKNVIKDTVLAQASHGSVLTMALFQNLQNPLLKKYKFDAEEFVQSVGPALENFHDVLMKLGNQLPDLLASELKKNEDNHKQLEEKGEFASEEDMIRKIEETFQNSLLGKNLWREQANKEEDSLAKRLAKMTTEDAFDAFYYSAKLVLLGSPTKHRITVESCHVGEVALLNARALVMDQEEATEEKIDTEHPEFQASEEKESSNEKIERVAAQMDVLYEVTHKYKQPIVNDPLSTSEQYKTIVGAETDEDGKKSSEDEADVSKAEKSPEEDDTKYETILTTTLGVAVLEGWLNGGPDGNDLRWKVALLRDAHEFPHQPTTTKV